MEDSGIYKIISKTLGSFSNLFPKKKIDYKNKKKVSVCGNCQPKLVDQLRKRKNKLIKRTENNPMKCAICKRKLAPPYMRSQGEYNLKDEN